MDADQSSQCQNLGLLERAISWITQPEQRSTGNYSTANGSLRSYIEQFQLNQGTVIVNEHTALSLPIAKRCIDLLSESLAWPDCELIQDIDGIRTKAKSHSCWSILYDSPSELHTPYYTKKQILMYGFGWGNGYGHIVRNGNGRPISINVYEPTHVTIYTDAYKRKVWYRIVGVDGIVQASDMIHFKPYSQDGIKGLSPVYVAFNTFKLGLQGLRFPAQMLENGSQLAGIIKHPQKLTDDAKNTLRAAWKQKFHGIENAGETAILDMGMDYQQIGISPVDAQLIEIMRLNNEQICALYGVPQHMVGMLDRSTNNNIEQQGIEFKSRLRPIATELEQEFTRKLLFEREIKTYYYQIKLDELDLTDLTAKKEFIQTTVSNAVLNPNEAREMLGLNPYEGGDVYRTQGANINVLKQDELIDSQIEANKSKAKPVADNSATRNGHVLHAINGHSAPVN